MIMCPLKRPSPEHAAGPSSGVLKREAGGFTLIDDEGERWRLELPRTPVDRVEKRVRVTGVPIGEGALQVLAIAGDAGP